MDGWTELTDGRTDDAKTISLGLCLGIKKIHFDPSPGAMGVCEGKMFG